MYGFSSILLDMISLKAGTMLGDLRLVVARGKYDDWLALLLFRRTLLMKISVWYSTRAQWKPNPLFQRRLQGLQNLVTWLACSLAVSNNFQHETYLQLDLGLSNILLATTAVRNLL